MILDQNFSILGTLNQKTIIDQFRFERDLAPKSLIKGINDFEIDG